VSPSADRATLLPKCGAFGTLLGVSFSCSDQTPPARTKIQAEPTPPLSLSEPISAVFPSADKATAVPKFPPPELGVSFTPCWTQPELVRTNTHTAPMLWLSPLPPRSSVFPSDDRATDMPILG